jgi:poly-gamma-glutamate capsule biosynthesis protein CapA/YwtB (metallophosphatase superfamily)
MDRREFLKTVGQTAAVAAASGLFPKPAGAIPDRLSLVAVGDCIITRRISHRRDPGFLEILELVRGADCAWGNCELVLADSRRVWPALKGADPHAIGEPWGADELAWTGVRFAGTANNHILDFGHEGMFATLENLERVGIVHAGSGEDLAAAARPAYFDSPAGRVGQVNCCSTFPRYFAAGPAHPHLNGRPGLNPVFLEEAVQVPPRLFEELKKVGAALVELRGWNEFGDLMKELEAALPKGISYFDEMTIASGEGVDLRSMAREADLKRVTEAIQVARNNSRVVLATIHSHEARKKLHFNDPFLQPFARACIDAGADAFLAAGPHVIRGIEIYKGKPIFYCLGNFVFQYETIYPIPAEALAGSGLDPQSLDPSPFFKKINYPNERRFWESIVPRVVFEGDRVASIEIFPITQGFGEPIHERGLPLLAKGETAASILQRLAELSKPFGTEIDVAEGVGRVRLG